MTVKPTVLTLFWAVAVAVSLAGAAERPKWTIYVANDNCPDYTWGFTEAQTRQAFADVVRGHLDEMRRTDDQPPDRRNRYNAAVTQEVLCFLEKYPDRKDELVRRVKEGRLFVSPYLCNSLWGFQSFEGVLRTFYPARRLEGDWGVRFDWAHHIELPSLPWGHASILAGCGFRGLTIPYLSYDTTFNGLRNPPLFWHEGPDGARVMVWLDAWSSNKANYTQGAAILNKPDTIAREWLPHYAGLGEQYATRAILASGTHGDINPGSGGQARGFSEKLFAAAARPDAPVRLVNATFAQFWEAVERDERQQPWLPTLRGCFGNSWDLWPICTAKYAAAMRAGEREMLTAEALLAVVALEKPELAEATRADRRRAEWCWAMLSDHAWNGTGPDNQRHNAGLRQRWSSELGALAARLQERAWEAAGLRPAADRIAVFNSLGFARSGVVRLEAPPLPAGAAAAGADPCVFDGPRRLPTQWLKEDGRDVLYFASPELPAFAWREFRLAPVETTPDRPSGALRAGPQQIEGRWYRATIDAKTGGLASLVHKPSGRELLAADAKRRLGETVYFDGREHTMQDAKTAVVAQGDVLARVAVSGHVADADVACDITLYDAADRVDFDFRIRKPAATNQNRLCHVFPLLGAEASLRIATPGAVVRPLPQPAGDLLPGADPRRFAVQEFVNVALLESSVTLVPRDAFVLRLDLDRLSIEAIGNDQNYKEVIKDQHGQTEFRVRYSLIAAAKGYDQAAAYRGSAAAATPLCAAWGGLPQDAARHAINFDPARAMATCLKPADDAAAGGVILRLQEVAGQSGPLRIAVGDAGRAVATDLLERDLRPAPIANGELGIELRPYGFAAVRLLR